MTHINLPFSILNWVLNSLSLPTSKITSIQQLKGGISTLIYKFVIGFYKNDYRNVILRIYNNKEWLKEEPDIVSHETSALKIASKLSIPTPHLINSDEKGEICGNPLVLMSELPGKVILEPDNMEEFIEQMAIALVNIHNIDYQEFKWQYFSYIDIEKFDIPSWSKYPNLWEKAINIANSQKPKYNSCFIHRDYHPCNILWHNNKITGIVDWVNACIGPVGVDIGHMRVNLAMLYGTDIADLFLKYYQKHAKDFEYTYYWDIISLIDILFSTPTVYQGWIDLGIHNLTDKLIIERLDYYLSSLL